MGILSHKAADILRKDARLAKLRNGLKDENDTGLRASVTVGSGSQSGFRNIRAPEECGPDDCESGKSLAFEVAIEQLMADESIRTSTKEVFRHVALMHEPPEAVAKTFGITRNNVDQIKKRMIDRLAAMVESLAANC